MAEYNARPQCIVQRDWLRLALKTLGDYVASLPDNAAIVFSFDGSLLSIRFDKKVIALPGEGSPWAVRFRVEARTLRRLPKRLMREDIGVSIWESRITLGNYTYAGTFEEFGRTDSSRVQEMHGPPLPGGCGTVEQISWRHAVRRPQLNVRAIERLRV